MKLASESCWLLGHKHASVTIMVAHEFQHPLLIGATEGRRRNEPGQYGLPRAVTRWLAPLPRLLSERHHRMPGIFLPLAGVCHNGFQIVVEFRRILFPRFAHLFNN